MRQVYPEDGGQLSFAEALIHLALPPLPLPSPAAPACRRGPDGSLTIAVEELEPVVNPVIGLFAVGFLGCIRTQRHKRRRREVGVSKWTDFEATFPILASGAGAEQAREQQKLRPTVIPLPPPAPNPTLTAPSPLPENSMRRSQEIPFPGGSGLGQQRQAPRAVAWTRAGFSRVPLALECEAGLASLQFQGLRANFFRAEPHGPGARVRPGRKVVWGTPGRSALWMLCTGGGARLPKRLGLLPGQERQAAALRPLTFSFSTNPTKAVLSISTGWPCLS